MISMRNNRVLIRRLPMPTQTKGGIILPTKATELPQIGTIEAIGWKNPEGLQVGNKVLLPKYGGELWASPAGDYYLYRTNELLAVIYD